MNFETIEVRKVNPMLGAEIYGIDLSEPLTPRQFDEIHRAWMENLVIIFRDQHLTVQQHQDFGRCFGTLHVHPSTVREGRRPESIEIKADEHSTAIAGEYWHSDVSCEEEPPMGSLLYITETPPNGGGDTMFANMYRAYETLSEPLRRLLLGLTAIHDSKDVFPGHGSGSRPLRFEHPVVRTHPITA